MILKNGKAGGKREEAAGGREKVGLLPGIGNWELGNRREGGGDLRETRELVKGKKDLRGEREVGGCFPGYRGGWVFVSDWKICRPSILATILFYLYIYI